MNRTCRFGFASLAALAVASVVPLTASAQGTEAEEQEVLEEIITTGTRLRQNPNLAAAVPVLSVTGTEGMERGNVRIEDFVNVLPQVFAGQASEISNGASGTATLNLRGLGSTRTLVLMDGRRLPYGASRSSSANRARYRVVGQYVARRASSGRRHAECGERHH